jgi:hypothetical protein
MMRVHMTFVTTVGLPLDSVTPPQSINRRFRPRYKRPAEFGSGHNGMYVMGSHKTTEKEECHWQCQPDSAQ